MRPQRNRLAADIGGTFTDVVLDCAGTLFTAKVPTSHERPEQGVMEGVAVVMENGGLTPDKIDIFVHGTTLATNALIERKGANTALLTTDGFRDSIEIAYESRFDQYDLMIDKPVPLVPRDRRFAVAERMNVRGEVLIDLDEAGVARLASVLAEREVEAVAIGLLHSYANPEHEQRVRDVLIKNGCDAEVSLSCEVCPEVREYERFMTTVCNAYVQPLMAGYLRALSNILTEKHYDCPLYLMTSGGGMTTLDNAIRFPIRLVESGPSGGAVLAATVAAQLDEQKVLAFDMGGTTAKISLIDNCKPKTARNFEIARAARFQKGSGMPVRIPVIEMIEIGAGGGSIAHRDTVERLCIGPQSAGAVPGPACFAKGGDQPTVTDANLLLGRIDPDKFAEGKMPLDKSAAQSVIDKQIAWPMSVSVSDAAAGITEMVEENMANAARIHSVEHGADLSAYTLFAFGGGGPLHSVRVAEKLGIQRVIVPVNSSVGSAIGFLSAPVSFELVQSLYMTMDDFDLHQVNDMLNSVSKQARDIVEAGCTDEKITEVRSAYMRYVGQGHEIQVPLPRADITRDDKDSIKQSYNRCYTQLYGRTIPDRDIEIMSWSVAVSSVVTQPQKVTATQPAEQARDQMSGKVQREAFLPSLRDFARVPVYWRPDLLPGDRLVGPALVEEPQTTCFVTDKFTGVIDSSLNLILEKVPE